jgi:ribosomal protein L3 glutamine methyltransferase
MPTNSLEMNTIHAFILQGKALLEKHDLFFGHGTSNALDESAYIVLSVTGNLPITSDEIYQHVISVEDQQKIHHFFDRRINERLPAAYLLEEAWFANLRFYVNENVLVPRSPFAELIYDLFEPWVDFNATKSILDLCTGSGCIGIAAAKAFPHSAVDLVDLSTEALDVANINIELHDVKGRVNAICSNLYKELDGKQYDLIISNPPYVCIEEIEGLPTEYRKEPRMGLDGGDSGLDLVHSILAYADEYLTDQGVIFVEVGSSAQTLEDWYPDVPFLWQDFEYGGDGVFMLTKTELQTHKQQFLVNVTQ